MIRSVLVFTMLSCGLGNPRGFALIAAAGAPVTGQASGAPDGDSATGGIHDAEPPIITINGDNPAAIRQRRRETFDDPALGSNRSERVVPCQGPFKGCGARLPSASKRSRQQ